MIEEAIKIAKRSRCGKYAMGCVIRTRDNKTVSNGWAHVPEMKEWRLYSLHAEIHAIARARNTGLENTIAYIAAVSNKSGNVSLAKPCRDCAIALFSAGVKEVYYTTAPFTIPQYLSLFHAMDHLETFKVYNSPQF